MDNIEQAYNAAYALADQDGLTDYELNYVGLLSGSIAFSCEPTGEKISYTGFPLYILVKSEDAYFADHDETLALMDMESEDYGKEIKTDGTAME